MANEVVSLRISEEVKTKLQKVFSEEKTTSEIIRATIESYLGEIERADKGIINFEVPVNCLNGEDLRAFYKDICELEVKVTQSVIESGYDYNLDYVKAIQRTKNTLIAHMSIENGSKELSQEREEFFKKLEADK